MALKPVARRLVPEDVFDQLLGEVVDGELAAGDPCPASGGWPRCWASPGRPCARRCSGSPRPGWSRCATAAARRCATSAPRPGSTCSPACWCATASSTRRSGRSILQARQAIAPAVAALAAETSGARRRASRSRRGRGDPGAGRGLRGPPARRARPSGTPSSTPPTRSSSGCCSTACGWPTSRPSPPSGPVMEAEVDNVAGYRALADADRRRRPRRRPCRRRRAAAPDHRGARATCSPCSTPDRTTPSPPTARKDHHDQAQPRDRGQGPRAPGRRRAADRPGAAGADGADHRRPAYLPDPRRRPGRPSGGTPPPG